MELALLELVVLASLDGKTRSKRLSMVRALAKRAAMWEAEPPSLRRSKERRAARLAAAAWVKDNMQTLLG